MVQLSKQEMLLLAEQYRKNYRGDIADRLAQTFAASLDPRLSDPVRRWLLTGEEQPFAFAYDGAVYSLQGVQGILMCNYLTALERMNDFVKDPERNYYRIIPC